MTTCPTCQGKKGRTVYACPGFRPHFVPCEACDGTGEMTDEQAQQATFWRAQGQLLREARIANRVNMRDAAAARGIDTPRYSRIEFGLEPAPWLENES